MNENMRKSERENYEVCKQIVILARLLTIAGYGKIKFVPDRIDKEIKK